ncbi:phosphonate C-P lyase [Alkalihalobacillus alcalophilus ATCC 27647 = CGMCC 1.3604]|uniref:Phosphonate C-P lyase n=1 Tax=Alkalihalobacillus alcalophilus ATCC 27647 = CGMCC 1.3604 TaxID=1218173 RepID=J8TQC4_ALKAL|nr:ATP-binding cassette domain-containing protein [Alkalihalobacillus alcalophilus]AFV25825.1 phosphonate transporter [Alkalihalobacillus alcalophilus ATCC 27647 = CGMCC 1.3604]KGA99032.1 phosphonate C-P lyase system protein PhnK [Alkalihalobacillus alcalophilus ATCC 27647 = CGMCC 1.3604]MED1560676.1 ATP-binding cassette domain-containing protein [Alkalihalobacillus alcalophilus]THG89824.1 phosphonate C-P lyase [Alkalihalobacillus alcalophilus ATCC 27647 = CGMCC 1.3604]
MFEKPSLSVRNLEKQFGEGCPNCNDASNRFLEKNYCPVCGTVYACQNVSFDLYPGEILGVVGESGSGKSTMMQCLYFDLEVTSGEAYIQVEEWQAKNLFSLSSQQKRFIRNHHYGMVYQNPIRGLKMDVSSIGNIAEKLIAAGSRNVSEMERVGGALLESVQIPLNRRKEEPRNFSGGMQQRVQIAKALSNNPPVLFLDEVTTGLDLSVQANVLDLIKQIQRELGISMLVVSHDLAVIKMLADRTIVMLNGAIIEEGLTDQVLEDPQHSYTQQLVYSLL